MEVDFISLMVILSNLTLLDSIIKSVKPHVGKPVPAPSLDSLFYKKQGNQTNLKESNFMKRDALSGDDILKRVSAFDFRATL